MINDVADIIIDKIETLPFLDKYAGLVKTLSYTRTDKDGRKVKKTFPAACNLTLEECEGGKYKDLCPDNTKKSVLYLEDVGGVRFVKREGGNFYWRASLNLVCWLNLPKLGYEGCSYSATAIYSIIAKLPEIPFNSGVFNRVTIRVQGQQTTSQNPFTRYTYDETVNQFLMYPFDWFVLPIEVEFITNKACLSITPIGTPLNCK